MGWALHIQAGCILPAPQEGGHFHFPDEKPSSCQPQHHPSSLDPASILARKSWGNRARPSLQTRRQVTCVVGQRERWRARGASPHTRTRQEPGGAQRPAWTLSRSLLDQLGYRETPHTRLFIEETLQLSPNAFASVIFCFVQRVQLESEARL